MNDQTTPDTNAYGVPRPLWNALEALVADDPDRATQRNGAGFNKADGGFAHDVYEAGFERCTPPRAEALYRLLRKYSGQLKAAGISYEDIALPAAYKMPAPGQASTGPAQAQAQGSPSAGPKGPRPPRAARVFLRDIEGDRCLCFESERDHPAIQIVRALPHRRWTGRDVEPNWCWRIALDPANLAGLRTLYGAGVAFDAESIVALKALAAEARSGSAKAPAGPQLAPHVCANLRGLEPSTAPFQ